MKLKLDENVDARVAEIDAAHRQIDQLVVELYWLTQEEMWIVEGTTK